jgi:hypothetical protein
MQQVRRGRRDRASCLPAAPSAGELPSLPNACSEIRRRRSCMRAASERDAWRLENWASSTELAPPRPRRNGVVRVGAAPSIDPSIFYSSTSYAYRN